jgi:hypothetical protein
MSPLQLPLDLERFLREKQDLVYDPGDCEVGKVSLEWLEDSSRLTPAAPSSRLTAIPRRTWPRRFAMLVLDTIE